MMDLCLGSILSPKVLHYARSAERLRVLERLNKNNRYFTFHAAANRFVQFFAQGNEQGPAKETGGCSRLQDVPFLICSFALSPEARRESSYLVRNRQGCSV